VPATTLPTAAVRHGSHLAPFSRTLLWSLATLKSVELLVLTITFGWRGFGAFYARQTSEEWCAAATVSVSVRTSTHRLDAPEFLLFITCVCAVSGCTMYTPMFLYVFFLHHLGQTLSVGCHIHNGTYLTLSLTYPVPDTNHNACSRLPVNSSPGRLVTQSTRHKEAVSSSQANIKAVLPQLYNYLYP